MLIRAGPSRRLRVRAVNRLFSAVLVHKVASKRTGLWEAAEEASKDVGSTLSDNLLVVVDSVAVHPMLRYSIVHLYGR